ncbi:GATA zinc finger domain containing protein [Musa troglodytarum]|uniref:GATA zinc finger domain containing protein n=1 Tax=Musa troglodytarum TaxID=320322 RepID=A0A9E7G562_9LILI|nr:GATA zinc finger domain containing protein [Musa troglodytarum]
MLHQCGHQSSTQQCSCGLLCGGAASFSIFFPASGSKFTDDDAFDGSKSDASSSVDCTLSLGTPSTRLTEHKTLPSPTAHIQPPSCMSSFRWDSLSHPKKHTSMGTGGSIASGGGNTIGSNMAGDPLLLARRCANCDTTSTPLWRNGPRGPKSLCNACGIRYKKEERRAAASPSSSTSVVTAASEQTIGYGYIRQQQPQQSPWGCYAPTATKSSPSISMHDDTADEGDVPYLSWRLNLVPPTQLPVRDRPSLFQYN